MPRLVRITCVSPLLPDNVMRRRTCPKGISGQRCSVSNRWNGVPLVGTMMAEDSRTQKTAAFCVQDPAFCVQIPALCVQLRSRSAAFCVQDPAFCVQILRSAFTCVLRSAAFRILRSAVFCVQLRSAFRTLRSAFRRRVPGRKGASAQMGQAAEGAVQGTVFHRFRLAFLRLATFD
eukprot:gene2490-biopygen1426